MTTRFIVVRHGETAWNVAARIQGHSDSNLTDVGRSQAAAIGARLRAEDFEALVSSDLGRAYETARIIASLTGHKVARDARLRERSFGVGEGLTYGELDHQYPDAFSKVRDTDPDFAIPGGESRRQFYVRVKEAFEALAREHAGSRLAVVAHGGVLASLYRVIHGLAIAAPHPIPIANASFNALAFDGSSWTVEAWGDTSHLDAGALFETL
ncbi:hypothetical protein BWI17_13875 [Betaproteobacteria bacterium GR16-43]|nr:hypothetical protein BWI17_13875 [Betaproteobacteria bacterium GR16-43]